MGPGPGHPLPKGPRTRRVGALETDAGPSLQCSGPWKHRERERQPAAGGRGAGGPVPGKACLPGPGLPGPNASSHRPTGARAGLGRSRARSGQARPLLRVPALRRAFFPPEPEADRDTRERQRQRATERDRATERQKQTPERDSQGKADTHQRPRQRERERTETKRQ